MKNLIQHVIPFVYRFEDIVTEAWRIAQAQLRNKEDVCRHPGCKSRAATGKVYCNKHLHGSR